VGGEVGDAEVVGYAGSVESAPLDISVEKGAGGKPMGGGKGRPRILLSGQDSCPFEPGSNSAVLLDPKDPPVYQRPWKNDYQENVFWINLQHPLADSLFKQGIKTVNWRSYHFQCMLGVYKTLEMRSRFGEDEHMTADQLLEELGTIEAQIYALAQEELFSLVYGEDLVLD
jgi:hypothetical protein